MNNKLVARQCIHCTTIINIYHEGDTCYLHEEQWEFAPEECEVSTSQPPICSKCGDNGLAPQNTTGICNTCMKEIRREKRKNFRSTIAPADKDPITNPQCLDIVRIIAHAYQITDERIVNSNAHKQEDVWSKRLTLYLISEDLKINTPKQIPQFYNLTNEKIAKACTHVAQAMKDDEKILHAVTDIRSRYSVT